MWDGVTYVEPSQLPIIHEGPVPATLVVTNVGPDVVDLLVWAKAALRSSGAASKPDVQMRMSPGNTRSVSGEMIGVTLVDDNQPALPKRGFAAIAWRVL